MAVQAAHRIKQVSSRDQTRPDKPRIRLALFNAFGLSRDEVAVNLSGEAQHLLAYLAVQQRALPREHVAGILWPDVPDERGAGNLRSALWRLRRLSLDLVISAHECLSLSASVIVDIRINETIARQVMDPTTNVNEVRMSELAFAGEFLPGWCQDWVLIERERQRQIRLHMLEAVCERWTGSGRFAEAVMAGLAAVAIEPLRETAHRVLIKAYLAEGNPAEAIRQYLRCRDVLREELHLEPSAQITTLVRALWPGDTEAPPAFRII